MIELRTKILDSLLDFSLGLLRARDHLEVFTHRSLGHVLDSLQELLGLFTSFRDLIFEEVLGFAKLVLEVSSDFLGVLLQPIFGLSSFFVSCLLDFAHKF